MSKISATSSLLLRILLGPVLLLQGMHVRRTTPKLPEAHGARNGVQGKGLALRLLIGQQRRLCALLMQRFGVRQVFFTSIPPVHRFPALPQPLRWYLGRGATKFNERLTEWSFHEPHATLVKVEFPSESHYMASDGFHPGRPAYEWWARATAQAILTAGPLAQ